MPLRADAVRREVGVYQAWFASHRPHQGLEGRTPQEVYDSHALKRPSFARDEPLSMLVSFHEGRRQLPIVELKLAA